MPSISERLAHAWNAFMNKDPTDYQNAGTSSYFRPDRVRMNVSNDRTIVSSIYNKIAVACAAVDIRHVRVDENGRYIDEIKSKLNRCLTVEANADQTGRNLMQEIVMTMFDEGCVAVVPTDTTFNPNVSDGFEIEKLRCGKIIEWYPTLVKVEVYDERTALRKQIVMRKENCAIIENPFYSIMNEPNGILKRLTRKLAILDTLDEKTCSGKLDLIIQLPYTLKSELRKQQAEQRRKELEDQLNSKIGVGYTDATEHIVQLNRPLENNLMSQVEYLTRMLYGQLGDEEIWTGKANEQVMLNFYTQTVEPILTAVTEEYNRKFLSKTALTQGQSIKFFRDSFKLVPLNSIADIGDKFTRNEILTSNEMRAILGMKPSKEPNANELRNKSLYRENTNQVVDNNLNSEEGGNNEQQSRNQKNGLLSNSN